MTEFATMTAPQNTRQGTQFARSRAIHVRRYTVPTDPSAFRVEIKELLGGPSDIQRKLERVGYTAECKTVGRWLKGSSNPTLPAIWKLLELMEAEHNRRDAQRRAFFGGG